MKRLLAVPSAAALTLALAACSNPSGAEPQGAAAPGDDAPAGVVSVWGWRQDAPWTELVESYNATDPVMEIEYRGYKADEYNSILQTGLAGGDGPDVMMLRSYGGLETVVAGGGVAAIGQDVPELAGFAESNLAGATSVEDGEVYGVPFQVVTANVIYNKTMFDELGLSEPTTWSEFIEVNDAIMAAGSIPLAVGALDSWALPIVRDLVGASAYGGPELQEGIRSGATDFLDPGYAAANQALLDLTEYFPAGYEGLSYADAVALFVSGQAAMFPGGIWELPTFQEQAPDIELGLFNVPRTDGSTDEPFAMGYVDGSFGMSQALEGDEREAALAFLSWTAGEEFGQGVADQLLALPTVPAVEPQDPLLAEATAMYAANPTPYLTYVSFDYGTPAGSSLEYDLLQRMLLGEVAPQEVGKGVQEGISQWFVPSE